MLKTDIKTDDKQRWGAKNRSYQFSITSPQSIKTWWIIRTNEEVNKKNILACLTDYHKTWMGLAGLWFISKVPSCWLKKQWQNMGGLVWIFEIAKLIRNAKIKRKWWNSQNILKSFQFTENLLYLNTLTKPYRKIWKMVSTNPNLSSNTKKWTVCLTHLQTIFHPYKNQSIVCTSIWVENWPPTID